MKKINFLELARGAAEIASDKKGEDIIILNIRRLTSIADYFVIATADSNPQKDAIVNTISKTFHENRKIKPIHSDGINNSHWSVLDYGGIIIHIMLPEARILYSLEKIWDGARRVK